MFNKLIAIETIGVVDDNALTRELYKQIIVGKLGKKVKLHAKFADIESIDGCDFWIFDNDTGEDIKGMKMFSQVPNSILVTGNHFIPEGDGIFKKPFDCLEIINFFKNIMEVNDA